MVGGGGAKFKWGLYRANVNRGLNTTQTISLDEFRMGDSYAEVVPSGSPPPPDPEPDPVPNPEPGVVIPDPPPDGVSIVAVTASSDDGHIPENTIDNDLNPESRWSASGAGEWIQYDLGQSQSVSRMGIVWYKGNQWSAMFDIEVSDNATSWTQVFSGSSSGTTLQKEYYDFNVVIAGMSVL